jgi:hypothetical protein
MKPIETIGSPSGFHARVYILILVHLLALSIKLFINAQIRIQLGRVILCTER